MKFSFTSSLSGRILSGYIIVFMLFIIAGASCLVATNQQQLIIAVVSTSLLGTGIISGAVYMANKWVILPIRHIDQLLQKASKGESTDLQFRNDTGEIGAIQQSIHLLIEGLHEKSLFATQIGKGNYEQAFNAMGASDAMGAALLEMRANLKKNAEEERKRNWLTAGQAQIGEILRKNYTNSQQLYDDILIFIVKYLQANQGGLFLVQNEQSDQMIELVSCYAYNRKKYQQKQIAAGEGLVGQAFLEKDTILLTEIPDEYLHITSGLGQANPTCLLIVPMQHNTYTHGVLELASFQIFEKHQIEFVEKMAESIASTIANVKTNEITHKLLDETRIQTEQMRAQEEEMRQNMEELIATQENQLRLQEELKANEEIMKQSLQELQQAKEHLEKKEIELIQANEKSQARANKFREKMEALDGEMESKISQINMLKKQNEDLLLQLSKYEKIN